ncbi:MAG: sporulation transcription factor Spo0A [Eubacteriales bacterium]|nr:sporulation transcription factor Spo0A [Eubacteriales bacterium]
MNLKNNETKYSAILADNNRDYLRLISGFLEETGVFDIEQYAFDGRQAFELTMKHKPDLLVMDLIMPALDGFAVLEELDRNGYAAHTKVVMMSAVGLDFILKKAESYGVDYIFLKPFEKDVFKKRILELMQYENDATRVFGYKKPEAPRDIVTNHIKMVGITANVKGYHYLRDAILLVHENFELMSKLTTSLYVSVAHKYNSTPQRVERAMRHAIETAWNRGNIKVLEGFFGYTILDTKGKPTNGEFIAMLADKLNTEIKRVD